MIRLRDGARRRPRLAPVRYPLPAAFSATVLLATVLLAACSEDGDPDQPWQGTVDTMATGRVVVRNPDVGLWGEGEGWTVVEEVRIGALEGDGPDMFGRILSVEAGADGRIYVLESQAQELRIFNADGSHFRTVGGEGGGPGELMGVMGMDWAPDGNLWIVDPRNTRISVFTPDGDFVTSHPSPGGFVVFPWKGGFDDEGRFFDYVFDPNAGAFRFLLVRYALPGLTPGDTLVPPRYEGPSDYFEVRSSDGGSMRAGVPYRPGLLWRRVPGGGVWFALTGDYRLFRTDAGGDTVRMVTKEFKPVPVTAEDVEAGVENLKWFTDQGGEVDRSRFPDVKPAIAALFLDEEARPWVRPVLPEGEEGKIFEVFDAQGRFLGRVNTPFAVGRSPGPTFRNGRIYAVTVDELDVPYVAVGRIEGPDDG